MKVALRVTGGFLSTVGGVVAGLSVMLFFFLTALLLVPEVIDVAEASDEAGAHLGPLMYLIGAIVLGTWLGFKAGFGLLDIPTFLRALLQPKPKAQARETETA